jgi:hypothetical protein
MNDFRTTVKPLKSDFSISHTSKILMMGSCFAENIGGKLNSLKFHVDLNPFGVLFNPLSLVKCLERLVANQPLAETELFYHNERWHSFMHHSKFSSTDKRKCLAQMNDRIKFSAKFIQEADYLILTFGTSWVFYHAETKQPVSNCHKLPSRVFERKILSPHDVVSYCKGLFLKLRTINPNLKIILTVSPVRHLKDGAEANLLSKSILLVAVHELCQLGYASYFPAYEIMLDDLRDYRFYDTDMVHPSPLAVEYIFEKFGNSFFNEEKQQINKDIIPIMNASKHRPDNPDSNAHKVFVKQILEKISLLENSFPCLDFTEEKSMFQKYVS